MEKKEPNFVKKVIRKSMPYQKVMPVEEGSVEEDDKVKVTVSIHPSDDGNLRIIITNGEQSTQLDAEDAASMGMELFAAGVEAMTVNKLRNAAREKLAGKGDIANAQ